MTRRRVLSDLAIMQMRRERAKGALIKFLAHKYGVGNGHICKVVTGQLYPHHPGPITKAINQDHCRRNHPYTPETLVVRERGDGHKIRICLVCRELRKEQKKGMAKGD